MTDSFGNPIPDLPMVNANTPIEEVKKTMSISVLRSNISTVKRHGAEVKYDPAKKEAEVTFNDGAKTILTHI